METVECKKAKAPECVSPRGPLEVHQTSEGPTSLVESPHALITKFSMLHVERTEAKNIHLKQEQTLLEAQRELERLRLELEEARELQRQALKMRSCLGRAKLSPTCVVARFLFRNSGFMNALMTVLTFILVIFWPTVTTFVQKPMMPVENYSVGDILGSANVSVVTWSTALNVCSRNTGVRWSRSDCDGCLCQEGSVWIDYNDTRAFGAGDSCVEPGQWDRCRNSFWGWKGFKGQHNTCWDLVFRGARFDPETATISIPTANSCFSSIQRKQFSVPCLLAQDGCYVRQGILPAEREAAFQRLNVQQRAGKWGFLPSVQKLLNITHLPDSAWDDVADSLVDADSKQLVSRYSVLLTDKMGVEHELVAWTQWEGTA